MPDKGIVMNGGLCLAGIRVSAKAVDSDRVLVAYYSSESPQMLMALMEF